MVVITCARCNANLPNYLLDGANVPCPLCGATTRNHFVTITDHFEARDGYRAKAKRPSLPSAKKLRSDSYSGVEPSHKHGKLVRVQRIIDKDNDLYFERISDLESGETLHECKEPLSEHTGRGSAKPRWKA
jgi:hypothetical protein